MSSPLSPLHIVCAAFYPYYALHFSSSQDNFSDCAFPLPLSCERPLFPLPLSRACRVYFLRLSLDCTLFHARCAAAPRKSLPPLSFLPSSLLSPLGPVYQGFCISEEACLSIGDAKTASKKRQVREGGKKRGNGRK